MLVWSQLRQARWIDSVAMTLEYLPLGFSLSLGFMGILLTCCYALESPLECVAASIVVVFCIAVLLARAVIRTDRPTRDYPTPLISRLWVAAGCFLLCLTTLLYMHLGSFLAGDAIWHVSRIKEILVQGRVVNTDPYFGDINLDPRYSFAVWHPLWATIMRILHLSPAETAMLWVWLSGLLVPIALASYFRLGRVVFDDDSAAAACLILVAVGHGFLGFGGDRNYNDFRTLPYPGLTCLHILLPTYISVFIAGGKATRARLAAQCILLWAIATTYLFGLFLAFFLHVLWVLMPLIRRESGFEARQRALSLLVAVASVAPYLILRIWTLEPIQNKFFLSEWGYQDWYVGISSAWGARVSPHMLLFRYGRYDEGFFRIGVWMLLPVLLISKVRGDRVVFLMYSFILATILLCVPPFVKLAAGIVTPYKVPLLSLSGLTFPTLCAELLVLKDCLTRKSRRWKGLRGSLAGGLIIALVLSLALAQFLHPKYHPRTYPRPEDTSYARIPPANLASVINVLRAQPPPRIVFLEELLALFLPLYVDCRVVSIPPAYAPPTTDVSKRRTAVLKGFRGELSEEEWQRLLQEFHVTHIVIRPSRTPKILPTIASLSQSGTLKSLSKTEDYWVLKVIRTDTLKTLSKKSWLHSGQIQQASSAPALSGAVS